DDDGMTWGQFYEFFAQATGLTVHKRTTAGLNGPVKQNGKGRAIHSRAGLFTSPEFKEFAKRVLNTRGVGTLPRLLIDHVPGVEASLRKFMGSDSPEIYRRETGMADLDELRITPRLAQVSSARAREVLGYVPAWSRTEALSRTLEWAKCS